MADSAPTLRVTGNAPRLLKEGESPPAPPELEQTAEELEVPHSYWTPDKAQHVVARVCSAASKFYGPSVKAAPWELELIGDPAAAVLNDWLPLRTGASSDKTANLLALGVVTAIIVALRLPDILEVHGVELPWAKRQRLLAGGQGGQRETPPPQPEQPASTPSPAAPPSGTVAGTFEPQLVGADGAAGASGDEDKRREAIYGAQTVGGSGALVPQQ